MTFRQFAFNNVSRNKRTYAAFFLSSVFSVMVFFMYAMFIFHPGIVNGRIHASAAAGMEVAEYIIFVFAFFFLFYSVSAFLKKREKEFGILFMHGMSRGQRNTLIFLENMIIGAMATVSGITLGMVFAKLFFLAAGYLLNTEPLPFYLPWEAIILTAAAFLVLFVTISIVTIVFLRKKTLLELLKGNQKPKSEPKASVGLSLLAALLLLTGYGLAFFAEGGFVPLLLLPVSAIVIAGTYFLFTQLSVFTIGFLKRNRSLYWNQTNLITLSDLAYRMKDNARMFFLVSIVSTVAFCAIGSLAAYASSIRENAIETNPFAFEYTTLKGNPLAGEHLAKIEAELRAFDPDFAVYQTTLRIDRDPAIDEDIALLKLSDYNRLAAATGKRQLSLNDNETVLLPGWGAIEKTKQITLQTSKITVSVREMLREGVFSFQIPSAQVLIVPDHMYASVPAGKEREIYGYQVNQWENSIKVAETLTKTLDHSNQQSYFNSRVLPYNEMRQMANTMLFVGLFVGVLFFVAAGSFLYFRLYTDLDNDKRQYSAITKIGLTEKELNRIVTTQIALLFFVPIVVAIVHSSVAFVSLQSLMRLVNIDSIFTPTAIVLGSFLVVQILYFMLIRSRYLHHLKQAIR